MDNLTRDWRKSSYSGGSGSANCVEAAAADSTVLVRDTAGVTLVLSARAWRHAITDVKAGNQHQEPLQDRH